MKPLIDVGKLVASDDYVAAAAQVALNYHCDAQDGRAGDIESVEGNLGFRGALSALAAALAVATGESEDGAHPYAKVWVWELCGNLARPKRPGGLRPRVWPRPGRVKVTATRASRVVAAS